MNREMREHSIRLLSESVRMAGFPDEVLAGLAANIRDGKAKMFYLPFGTKIDGIAVTGELFFEEQGERGFAWRSFGLDLGPGSAAMVQENTFPVGNGYDLSLREAYNLMHGRWLYKEPAFDPEKKGYWVSLGMREGQMDNSRLDYIASNFQVEDAMADSGLGTYLDLRQKKELIASLKQGNRQALVLEVMGAPVKVWAEAMPAFWTIRVSDVKGRMLHLKRQDPHPAIESAAQRRSKARSR